METETETPVEPVLKGQVAVVTGRAVGSAGRRRTARRRGRRRRPSSPAPVTRWPQPAAALKRGDVRALGLRADVRRSEDVDAAFEDIRNRLGPPTLLVNNAGLFSAIGPVRKVDPKAW
jgi:NAD(P)-dependent dehydrogenase (short-subunit alcohol dehydrogenase family)